MPEMDQAVLAEIKAFEASGDIENPRYMELLTEHHYVRHVLRMPVADWPDPVQRAFAHINPAIYVPMQGPSELGISAGASLAYWDRTAELAWIEVPALVIGARAGHRCPPRHHGPGAHEDDGRPPAPRPLPVLSGRQPHGHVRRPGGLLHRPHRLPARHRKPQPSLTQAACASLMGPPFRTPA